MLNLKVSKALLEAIIPGWNGKIFKLDFLNKMSNGELHVSVCVLYKRYSNPFLFSTNVIIQWKYNSKPETFFFLHLMIQKHWIMLNSLSLQV